MKPIADLTTPPPPASAGPTSSAADPGESSTLSRRLTERHIALLWERMVMIYGHRWTSSYGEADDGTWLAGLHDVMTDQIGIGLEKCRTNGEPWPPTLPEFRAMCRPPVLPPYRTKYIPLPKPPTNPEVVKANIDEMRRLLSGA